MLCRNSQYSEFQHKNLSYSLWKSSMAIAILFYSEIDLAGAVPEGQ